MASNEAPEKKQKKGLLRRPVRLRKLTLPLWLAAIAGCCILSVGICGIGGLLESAGVLPTPSPTAVPMETPIPTDTIVPTNTPIPTDTAVPTDTPIPAPTETLSPEESVGQIVHDALRTGNREVQRIQELRVANDGWVQIEWAINDNLSEDMIKRGAKRDVTDVAEALCKAGYCDGLTMRGTFSMVDQYGNASENVVVEVVLRPETLEKINWDNFLFTNIYAIADTANIHPAFQD